MSPWPLLAGWQVSDCLILFCFCSFCNFCRFGDRSQRFQLWCPCSICSCLPVLYVVLCTLYSTLLCTLYTTTAGAVQRFTGLISYHAALAELLSLFCFYSNYIALSQTLQPAPQMTAAHPTKSTKEQRADKRQKRKSISDPLACKKSAKPEARLSLGEKTTRFSYFNMRIFKDFKRKAFTVSW